MPPPATFIFALSSKPRVTNLGPKKHDAFANALSTASKGELLRSSLETIDPYRGCPESEMPGSTGRAVGEAVYLPREHCHTTAVKIARYLSDGALHHVRGPAAV